MQHVALMTIHYTLQYYKLPWVRVRGGGGWYTWVIYSAYKYCTSLSGVYVCVFKFPILSAQLCNLCQAWGASDSVSALTAG